MMGALALFVIAYGVDDDEYADRNRAADTTEAKIHPTLILLLHCRIENPGPTGTYGCVGLP